MTPEELCQLLSYVQENNSWNKLYEVNVERNRKAIKYVDACFDSRDGKVWHINFRDVSSGTAKEFRIENADDLKKVYEWLDRPLKNRN